MTRKMVKPLGSVSNQQEPPVSFCCVQECKELACFRCSEIDKCPDNLFCTMHGPEHDQHQSQFFKTHNQLMEESNSYNVQLMNTALIRVKDRANKDLEKSQSKKKQVKKRIRELQSAVDDVVEATTIATEDKRKKREKVIEKNKEMLELIGKRLEKKKKHNHAYNAPRTKGTKSFSTSNKIGQLSAPVTTSTSSHAPSIQTDHRAFHMTFRGSESYASSEIQTEQPPTSVTSMYASSLCHVPLIETDLQSPHAMLGISNSISVSSVVRHNSLESKEDGRYESKEDGRYSIIVEGGIDTVRLNLKKTVDHLIEGANDNGKSRRVINFDVCMEESLNTGYYKQHLKYLIPLYHVILTPKNWNALINTDFEGNTKQQKARRSLFIAAVCDSLRNQNIVIVEKIGSRFK